MNLRCWRSWKPELPDAPSFTMNTMDEPSELVPSAFRLRVVVPVYNDWKSFSMLLLGLDRVAAQLGCRMTVSAVNDGSTEPSAEANDTARSLNAIEHFEIIHLWANAGHQRAIAIGLCQACDDSDFDAVTVLDADGEDPPETIPTLLRQALGLEDFCVVAARRKRSETLTFKASYLLYKAIFKIVTGKQIGFGNYSVFSASYARRLVMVPDLWNNLPAAVLRSRLPIREVFVDRGKRYAGRSKMNFTSLLVHGFSAISVYAETIFVRLLVATLILVLVTVVAIASTLLLRLFVPAHATPGWATTVSFGMIIIFLQVLFTTLTSMLMLLNSRVQRLVLPIVDYKPYVREREVVHTSVALSLS
jgi:hypothetical protein